jgi:hypothetical protein
MSDEQPLHPSERDLAAVASRRAQDAYLAELVQRASVGAGLPVGLLVNGMIVLGQLAPPELIAKVIDTEWQGVLARIDKPHDMTDEEWAESCERGSTRAMRLTERYRAELDQLGEDAKPYGDPDGIDVAIAPADIGRRTIAANMYSHVTIAEARIVAPGQPGTTTVPALRIAADQIAGWWVLPSDAAGKFSASLWRTDDPSITPAGASPPEA